jgi:spermidine/putrescine transport system ATP-binding protein
MLAITGARKSFATPEGGEVKPLDGIDLSIQNNEFLTLLGPSGCGKTTLLKTIAGFEDLDQGEMRLDGQPIDHVPAHRRPFNTVFQNYALFPHMTVAENVAYGLEVAGVPRAARTQRVTDALRLVSLSGLERRKPSQLSGGQQQRVALARALVNHPRILLLDEPLSALDRKLRQSMQIELKALQHNVGVTFLLVTHDQEEALSMSDRIAVMDRGHILQIGTPKEIYDTPISRFVATFIGTSNILSGSVVADGARTVVRTASGTTVHFANKSISAGEEVDVVIRPEELHLVGNAAASRPDRAELKVTVQTVVFLGSDLHLHGHLDDGTPITALHRHAREQQEVVPTPGQVVTLGYPSSAPHLMRKEPSA